MSKPGPAGCQVVSRHTHRRSNLPKAWFRCGWMRRFADVERPPWMACGFINARAAARLSAVGPRPCPRRCGRTAPAPAFAGPSRVTDFSLQPSPRQPRVHLPSPWRPRARACARGCRHCPATPAVARGPALRRHGGRAWGAGSGRRSRATDPTWCCSFPSLRRQYWRDTHFDVPRPGRAVTASEAVVQHGGYPLATLTRHPLSCSRRPKAAGRVPTQTLEGGPAAGHARCRPPRTQWDCLRSGDA